MRPFFLTFFSELHIKDEIYFMMKGEKIMKRRKLNMLSDSS